MQGYDTVRTRNEFGELVEHMTVTVHRAHDGSFGLDLNFPLTVMYLLGCLAGLLCGLNKNVGYLLCTFRGPYFLLLVS